MTIENIIAALGVDASSTGKYRTICPSHGGKKTSLVVNENENGSVHLHCFAGCTPDEILSSIGLSPKEAWKPLAKIDNAEYKRKMARCNRICEAINVDIGDVRKLSQRIGEISELEAFRALGKLCPSVFNNPKRTDQKTRDMAMKARLEWYGAAISLISSQVMLAMLFDMSLKIGEKHELSK